MDDFMKVLDDELRPFAHRLSKEVRIPEDKANQLASVIAEEFSKSSSDMLEAIRKLSPISIKRRLFTFENYQFWARRIRPLLQPELVCQNITTDWPPVRVLDAQRYAILINTLYMNYIYAGDGFFELLKRKAASGSVAKKIAGFIRDNPLRALRNAVAHGNWYLTISGIKYFARKGGDFNEPIVSFEASVDDLVFYEKVTSCVAWAALLSAARGCGKADGSLENV